MRKINSLSQHTRIVQNLSPEETLIKLLKFHIHYKMSPQVYLINDLAVLPNEYPKPWIPSHYVNLFYLATARSILITKRGDTYG